jgi:pentatricopeptide repeat protein
LPHIRGNHTATATATATEQAPDTDDDPPNAEGAHPPKNGSKRRDTLTEEELLALVDPYDGEEIGPVDDYLQLVRDPYMRGYAPPDVPKVWLARTKEDVDYPSVDQVIQAGEEEQKTLWELRFAVLNRLRSPHKVDLDDIYEIYQRLPEPRMLYIHGRLRHHLLKALGQPEKRDSKSMLRYFAAIADVKNMGIPLTSAEWNSAIAFASKYVGVVSEAETETALKQWREMECEAGVMATDVTFNILFDVASKSGNFTLAEMIYREMAARGHRYNRYHYTSLIHFFGLKLDTSGMRAAYREMILAGEVIDTVPLNAMLSGLLRAGEEATAERLYERMKALSTAADAPDIPVRTPTTNRAITTALLMFGKLRRRHGGYNTNPNPNPKPSPTTTSKKTPLGRPNFQSVTLLAPDLQTYRILVNHYGVDRGDLAKVAKYLDDMKLFRIPLHGAIFLALFKGFARHGGYEGSAWSAQRLEGIWNALLSALDRDNNLPNSGNGGGQQQQIEVKTWLAIWALRAFARCSGTGGGRVLDVYEELKARWRLGFAEEQFMADFLRTSGVVSGFGAGRGAYGTGTGRGYGYGNARGGGKR